MSPPPPSRLLEITIISAQDLPPVSKMLRTFAVAYIHPDHKLTTKIDHQGHTNPTWNYQVVFPVDDKFLKNPSAVVTFEIYNLAWLRDLPVGTARLLVSSLSPPLHKNPAHRRVSVRISRPSGHLRGTLHLGIQLVDKAKAIPGGDVHDNVENKEQEGYDSYKEEGIEVPGPRGCRNIKPNVKICTSPSPESRETTRSNNYPQMKQALPREVETGLRQGLFSTSEWKDYRTAILERWMESEGMLVRTPEEKTKTGLFSCFGKGDGF